MPKETHSDNANPARLPMGERHAQPVGTSDKGEILDTEGLVGVLNNLLENVRDGEFGFQACADEVAAPALRQLFYHRAKQCHQAADELVRLIWRFGATPSEGARAGGTMRHGWEHDKAAFDANSDLSMLEECKRREDVTVALYCKALNQDLPPQVRDIVERQAQRAQRNLDRVQDMSNEAHARQTARE